MAALFLGIAGSMTAQKIAEIMGKAALSKVAGWSTGKALEKVFENKEESEILGKLKDIDTAVSKLQSKLHDIEVDIKWEHWNSRIIQAENGICSLFRIMQTVWSINDRSERSNQMEKLKTAVLDIGSGVLSMLSVVHEVLVGHTVTEPSEEGLLVMWTKIQNDRLIPHPKSVNAYENCVMSYFHSIAILQYKGFLLFSGVCDSPEFCKEQILWMKRNCEFQIKITENLRPAAMKYLTNPVEKRIFGLQPASLIGDFSVPLQSTYTRVIRSWLYDSYKGDRQWSQIGKSTERSCSEDNTYSGWVFEESGDGFVRIKKVGKESDSGYRYIKIIDNKPYSDGEKNEAELFYVLPMITTDKTMKVIFCTSAEKDKRFLGYNKSSGWIECVDRRGNIEFIMTLLNN